MKTVILIIALTATSIISGQNPSSKNKFDENDARLLLNNVLYDASSHNIINSNRILLVEKKQAVDYAENILFDIYGRQQIRRQRPYQIFNIDNHWIISGTLRKGWHGGTFLIIIDSRDCRIVRITHGK